MQVVEVTPLRLLITLLPCSSAIEYCFLHDAQFIQILEGGCSALPNPPLPKFPEGG